MAFLELRDNFGTPPLPVLMILWEFTPGFWQNNRPVEIKHRDLCVSLRIEVCAVETCSPDVTQPLHGTR